MSEPAWFEFTRPPPGKLRARPVHPIGWLLLFGVPFPGLILGLLSVPLVGRVAGLLLAFGGTGIAMWLLFRLVVRRGREIPKA